MQTTLFYEIKLELCGMERNAKFSHSLEPVLQLRKERIKFKIKLFILANENYST